MNQLISDIQQNFAEYYQQVVEILPKLVLALIILFIIWLIADSIKRAIKKRLVHRLEDPLLAGFLAKATGIGIKLIGLMIFLKILGMGSSVAAFLGAASVGTFVVGFALKDIGEHFLAGIMLAFNRPFRVGDVVEINGIIGKVLGISLRNTHLKTFDGKDVYVPNGNFIKSPLYNFTIDGFLRHKLEVGIAYDADSHQALSIVKDIIKNQPGVILEGKEPDAFVTNLDDSSVAIDMYYWINPLDPEVSAFNLKSNILQKIKESFGAANIEIPYNVLTIIQKESK